MSERREDSACRTCDGSGFIPVPSDADRNCPECNAPPPEPILATGEVPPNLWEPFGGWEGVRENMERYREGPGAARVAEIRARRGCLRRRYETGVLHRCYTCDQVLEDVAWLLADRERQAAENERLRAALAPFADHARAYHERVATLTDADLDVCEGHSIRISDCRRALAAESGEPGATNAPAELERLRAQITAVLYQIEVARSENRLAHWQAWELAQTVERLLAGNAATETGEPE